MLTDFLCKYQVQISKLSQISKLKYYSPPFLVVITILKFHLQAGTALQFNRGAAFYRLKS